MASKASRRRVTISDYRRRSDWCGSDEDGIHVWGVEGEGKAMSLRPLEMFAAPPHAAALRAAIESKKAFGVVLTNPENDGIFDVLEVITSEDQPLFIRHELDPAIIAESVERRISKLEEMRIRWKAEAASENRPSQHVDSQVEDFIKEARDYHGRVRVVERLHARIPSKPYYLVYGEDDDASPDGSDGFPSVAAAQAWFAAGDR